MPLQCSKYIQRSHLSRVWFQSVYPSLLLGLQTWDEQTLQWIVEQAPLSFAQGITWESPGNLIGMLPVVIAFVAIAAWLSRPLIAATMAVAYGLQFAFAWTGWLLWNRDRPDLVAGGIAAPGLHSFPLGHCPEYQSDCLVNLIFPTPSKRTLLGCDRVKQQQDSSSSHLN